MSSDSVQLCLSRKTGEMLQRLRANRPLVHCITNEVVQEITADVLLAAGASPAMVVGEGEAEYFAGIASALSVNVGTPYEARIETMKKAIRGALAAGKPWVLDPVAAGGIPWRDKIIFELLEMHPTAVRGNASEIRFLAGVGTGGKGVDAIMAYPHNYGCSQLGDDHENTKKILRDMVLHPNAGAVLVVGLGCENNQPDVFREFLGEYDEDRVKFMVTQKVGDEYEEGMKLLRELYEKASKDERVDVPLSELRVGLKCGGSDGFSGITANPLLGMFSDFLVAQGGTSVLTEVPEMFGAETILMNRCRNKELFEETVKLINDFKEYFLSHGEPVGENPSPGNKAGGISTLEDKALGCTQKCGTSYVEGVLPYGERLKVKGLNLLSAPGNDLVAATALASCGCHMVLFTTGRGTPFGTYVPTMKISTNSTLAKNKPGWIDFNAGVIVENEPMEKTCERFIEYIIKVASGEFVNNEKKGYREIAIFKTGVTL